MSSPGLVRTIRIRSHRKTGGLGILTTALGDAGASIGEIHTVRIGHNYTLRDFNLLLDNDEHLRQVLESISVLRDSELVEVRETTRDVHLGGKVRTASRVDLSGLAVLAAATQPGVREIVQAIEDEPRQAEVFTTVQRTVAIVTDGSGLVGVGKVHPRAMLPVLEGMSAVLAQFAGLSSMRLALDVDSEDELIHTVAALAPSCGAILIDSVAAPRGPRAAAKLADRLKVPVYHDDADSPAIVGLAAVINACRRAHLDPASINIGQIGLGTAGGAIARLVMRHSGRAVLGDDVHPAAVSRHVSAGGEAASLDDIMAKCDVVVANTGHAGVIAPSKVREGQVIIALSEPRPEIEPYDAQLAGAAFAADGKAISTVAAVPGVLLGALAVKAAHISDQMRLAAAVTLAACAPDGDLVPTPLDPGVHAAVAAAVARAALAEGVAQARVAPEQLDATIFEEAIRDLRPLPLG
ncbi:MAG: NAD-dependent malic enzyme [Deltaproteobacteria bacterium]|nr:NAD-dependent malic enzyme [Deltaproteobacteria bacterium]